MVVSVAINIVVGGVSVLCLYITYFRPLFIKNLEGASAVSSGAHPLRKCARVSFDKKVAWPQSLGSGSSDRGTMIYRDGNAAYVNEI